MLPKRLKNGFYHFCSRAVALLIFCITSAYADPPPPPSVSPTAQSMLANIATQAPAVMKMVTAIAYVLGFYFIFYGLMKLKQFGEQRTQMSGDHSLMPSLLSLCIGATLIYLPTTVQVGLTTFWSNPSPYGYVTQNDEWGQFYSTAFIVIQVLGVIAFIRGLLILSELGGHSQQNTFGRGMTHIIGGIFCINLYQFIQVVLSTLGIQA